MEGYYQAQCCERLCCTCRAMVRPGPMAYPLDCRILDLARLAAASSRQSGSVAEGNNAEET